MVLLVLMLSFMGGMKILEEKFSIVGKNRN